MSTISLEYLENITPHKNSVPQQTVLLCHGYGADAYDLRSLSEFIRLEKPTRWIFPQGYLEVPIGPGWTGRAWWEIDMLALQQAMRRSLTGGETKDYSNSEPKGLTQARQAILDLIWKLEIDWNHFIIGGFSQGAMLTTDVAIESADNPKAVVHLSGSLLREKKWRDKAQKKQGQHYFLSHGHADQVLPHSGALNLDKLLKDCGWKGNFYSFAGGHEIPANVCTALQNFLNNLDKK